MPKLKIFHPLLFFEVEIFHVNGTLKKYWPVELEEWEWWSVQEHPCPLFLQHVFCFCENLEYWGCLSPGRHFQHRAFLVMLGGHRSRLCS